MVHAASLTNALKQARELAIANKINFIDTSTLLIAILSASDNCSVIFPEADKSFVLWGLHKESSALHGIAKVSDDIPLTTEAEMACRFATQYALTTGDGELDAYHILMAMLSYNNTTNELFSRRGWIFDNFLAALNTLLDKPIEINVLQYNFTAKQKPFPWWVRLFTQTRRDAMAGKLLGQAGLLYKFRKYRDCRQMCAIALTLAPAVKIHYVQLCVSCFYNEKLYDDAVALYEENKPGSKYTQQIIAHCYLQLGRFEVAIAMLSALEKEPDICNNIGFSLLGLERYEEAIEMLDEAISSDREHAYAYNNKGYALIKTGRLTEAKAVVEQSLLLDKGNAYAYRNLAILLIAEKNKAEATVAIDKALLYKYREKYGADIDSVIEDVRLL